MDTKSEDAMDLQSKVERDYENALLKLKTIERDHEKEVMDLRILYQSEKEKSEVLEKSLKKYMAKISYQQNKLTQYEAKAKIMKATIEELTSSHSDELILKRLENELKSFKESTLNELKNKELVNQKVTTELEKYKKAFEQIQIEYKTIRTNFTLEKDEKEEILTHKNQLESELSATKLTLETLEFEYKRRISEKESEETVKNTEKYTQIIGNLQKELEETKSENLRLESFLSEARSSKLKIAYLVDKQEREIRELTLERDNLLKDSENKAKEIKQLSDSMHNQAEDVEINNYMQETRNQQLIHQMSLTSDSYRRKAGEREEELEELNNTMNQLRRQVKSLENEKKTLREKNLLYKQNMREMKKQLKNSQTTYENNARNWKEEMNKTILKLRTERDELKSQVEDLQSQIDVTRNSILLPGFSLNEEFGEIKDNEVVSVFLESVDSSNKAIEVLKAELSEKDFLISTLNKQKEDLETESNFLHKEISRLNETANDGNPIPSENDMEARRQSIRNYRKAMNLNELSEIMQTSANDNYQEIQDPLKEEPEKIQITVDDDPLSASKLRSKTSRVGIVDLDSNPKEIQFRKIKTQNETSLHIESKMKETENTLNERSQELVVSIKDVAEISPNHTKQLLKAKTQLNIDDSVEDVQVSINERPSIPDDTYSEYQINRSIFKDSIENSDFERSIGPRSMGFAYEIQSQRDMLQAEVHRLQTQLTLTIQEWATYNNQLRDDLEKEQKEVVRLALKIERIQDKYILGIKEEEPKKKPGWFKRKFGNKAPKTAR